jgi:hypothetical protein
VSLILVAPLAVALPGTVPGWAKNIVEKETIKSPTKLQALTPKMDESEQIKLQVEETRNLDISMQNLSGWNQLYNAGRTLFAQGDYRRALNAFRAAYSHSADDGRSVVRDKATRDAIEMTRHNLSQEALLGYKLTASANGTKTVSKVFRPSLAWLAGIKDGDKILSQKTVGNRIELAISRNGKRYAVSLKAPVVKMGIDPLVRQTPLADTTSLSGRVTNPMVLQVNEKELIKWDCIILIDCSGSMSSTVNTSNGHMSKWDWCVASSRQLLADSGKYFPNGITVVPFHHKYAVLDRVNVTDVNRIYEALRPMGGTEMASPLGYVLQRRFGSTTKPVVVAVLTDGMPGDIDDVRTVIADAAARTSGDKQVAITFLQVGDDGGTEILRTLDDDLVAAGASCDIVDSRYFDELQQLGIKGGLVAAIMEREAEGRAVVPPASPPKAQPSQDKGAAPAPPKTK